jgi:hypothetical protein
LKRIRVFLFYYSSRRCHGDIRRLNRLAHIRARGNAPEYNGTYSREDIYAEESVEEREAKRQKSIAWIKSHVEEYGGKYVALDGDKLIAVGDRHGDALKAVIKTGYKKAFVGFVYPNDYVGYWGGWN